jgi:hypothetical protein
MGCCNEPATTLAYATPDPSQHVNYAKGMVLGVDDFTQEFAYLAGRDQWLARDAIGYGTLSGLRVFAELTGADGPRLQVTAGSALVPSGKLVCVTTDQCAIINKWLAKKDNAATVNRLLNPVSPPVSPPLPPTDTSGVISLYLTLCSADCTTRMVPIPGEPCRSDDELMAPSRVADDYRLELRADAPVQLEEDALRDFVHWLHAHVQVVDVSSPEGDDASWLEMLRSAARPGLDASASMSASDSFGTIGDLFSLSSPDITVAHDRLCEFLRVAFRFWVTELRPLWMARRCQRVMSKDQDCVLLARVEFEVAWFGGSPTGAWQIVGSPVSVFIDETTRPFIAHARMLQEWLLCGRDAETPGSGLAHIGGTPHQIHVISGPGGITISTPQNIDTISAPEFAGLKTTGAVQVAVSKAVNGQNLDAAQHVVLCDNTVSTINLPPSVPAIKGRVYIIRSLRTSGNVVVSVAAPTADLIDGSMTIKVAKDDARTLVSDGNGNWHIIAAVL